MKRVADEAGDVDSAGVYYMSVEAFEARAPEEAPVRPGRKRMWFSLRPVEIDFLEKAPRITDVQCDVRLPRAEVWKYFTDPTTWPRWFPGVRTAAYLGDPPYGVGTIRVANVSGCHFEETMLAWDEGRRWAYRIDRASVPLAKAQIESSEFEDVAEGTRVHWRLALDPGIVMKLSAPFFRGTVERVLERALRNLEELVAREGPSASAAGD